MGNYSVFFSWQSDKNNVRGHISKALASAVSILRNEGYFFEILQDSRQANGSENISVGILNSITKSDLFIGDLTPVTQYEGKDGQKLTPNSNVMFEYGYALSCLGDSRCKQIICLEEGQKMKDMPFDINQRKSIIFSLENKKCLASFIEEWLREKVAEIEEWRSSQLPAIGGLITFDGSISELSLHPEFERITYVSPSKTKLFLRDDDDIHIAVSGPIDSDSLNDKINLFAGADYIPTVRAQVVTETLYESRLPLKFEFHNIGDNPLDNVNIFIYVSKNSNAKFYKDNKELAVKVDFPFINEISVSDEGDKLYRKIDTINPRTYKIIGECFISIPYEEDKVVIEWKFNSRTYNDAGKLVIHSTPVYRDKIIENLHRAGEQEVNEIISYK